MVFFVFLEYNNVMEQDIGNQKIEKKRLIIISVSTIIVLVVVLVAITIFWFLRSFSGAPIKDSLSKYDNKIYSVNSKDGKVEGFIATKIMSCGEFPSDLCLSVLSNIIIKEPLSIERGSIKIGNILQNGGTFSPIRCNNVNLNKIIPIWKFNQIDCAGDKSNEIKATYVSAEIPIESFSADALGTVDHIEIYASDTTSKLLKTYQVAVQPISLPENKYIKLAKCRESGGDWSESKCQEGKSNLGIIEDTYHCNCICCK